VTASVAAGNKSYDGTNSATITSCTPAALFGADVVTCSAAGPNTFSSATVANGKTVTATNISLGGADAANYVLSSTTATTTANIKIGRASCRETATNTTDDGT